MKGSDAAVTVIGIGGIGIFVAYIFYYLAGEGIWIDQYVTIDNTLTDIMAIVMLIFILVGVIVAAARSR